MSPALREKRVGRGPHGWTDSNRDKAAAVNSSKVKAHDAEAVPIIRDLRRTWAVVAIDRRLPRPLHGPARPARRMDPRRMDPQGSPANRGAPWHPVTTHQENAR